MSKRIEYNIDKIVSKDLSNENDFLEFIIRLKSLHFNLSTVKLKNITLFRIRSLIDDCFCNIYVECSLRLKKLNN